MLKLLLCLALIAMMVSAVYAQPPTILWRDDAVAQNLTIDLPCKSKPSISGWLHTSGKNILDENDNIVYLRGVNKWSTCVDNPWATWEKVTEDDFAHMKRVFPNMNTIWILLQARKLYPNWSSGNYDVINETYLGLIDNWVSWCGKYNLRCVLQMHYIDAEGMYNTPDVYSDFWTNNARYRILLKNFHGLLAHRYKTNSACVGFDILNEVGWTNSTLFKEMMTEVAQYIQSKNSNVLVIVQWRSWYSGTTENWLKTLGPINLPNLVYNSHHYWRGLSDGTWNTSPYFDHIVNHYKLGDCAGGKTQMETDLKDAVLLNDVNVPCVIGEFGVATTMGDDYPFLLYMRDFLHLMDKYNLGWSCFNWGASWHTYSLSFIKTNTRTADKWEPPDATYRPTVEVLKEFIGGFLIPADKLALLPPYLALLGLLVATTVAVAATRRRKRKQSTSCFLRLP